MPERDWYAEWLLGEVAALRRCRDGIALWVEDGEWVAEGGGVSIGDYERVDALSTLYRALTGHEPPPRPTEEEVRAWLEEIFTAATTPHSVPARVSVGYVSGRLRKAAASDDPRDRLMARAVVEMPMGGGS